MRPNQGCHMISSDLAKYLMTGNIARSPCDGRASRHLRVTLATLREYGSIHTISIGTQCWKIQLLFIVT